MVFGDAFSIYCFHTLRQDPLLSHFPLQESLSKKNQIMDHSDRGCEEMQHVILVMLLESPTQVFLVGGFIGWGFLGWQLPEFL